MKLYFIYSRSTKDIVYKSTIKEEVLNFFNAENLDDKYYSIAEVDSGIVDDYIKGNLKNDRVQIYKLMRNAI